MANEGWLDAAGIRALASIWQLGARKAAEGLTAMAGDEFYLADVNFQRLPLSDLSLLLGEPDRAITSVLLEIKGDCRGEVLLLLPQSSSKQLVDAMFGNCDLTAQELVEQRTAALMEAGNILGSAFLNAIATLTDLEILPTVPTIAEDMIGAVLDILQIKYATTGDHIFIAKSGFVCGAQPLEVFLITILEHDSLEKIVSITAHGKSNAES